jgi:hypothetical protein
MQWINAGDIKSWSDNNQRDCASFLPQLLRRLALATANSVSEVTFPDLDSVATPGWDGRLNAVSSSLYLPDGISGWEMGTKESPKSKADGDYTKRVADPLGMAPQSTTFVFVTPRRWPKRHEWASGKAANNQWKAVKAIDADDLALWLDQVPAVGLWLAKHLGKAPSGGIRTLESFWEEWSATTNPSLSTEVVVGGRDKQAEIVHNWLNKPPAVLSFQGDSADEPFAFLYSSFSRLPDFEKIRAFSKCIYVDSQPELRHILDTYNIPLILAVTIECNDLVGLAVKKGHHVFLGTGANVSSTRGADRLSRPLIGTIQENLKRIGVEEVKARRLSKDSGRSLPVLRRRMSTSPAITAPDWVNPQNAHLLLPVLFIGAWNEKKDGDQQIVEYIAGKNYAEYLSELGDLLTVTDPPLLKVGNVWMLKSPIDAWFLIARYANEAILQRYQQVVKDVLLKKNPKYELPADQRWAAAVYGKAPLHSDWLREGLCSSLAMISVFGDQAITITSLQDAINQTVAEILGAATTMEHWASLKDISPLLAEAAPDVFLEVVRKQLTKHPQVFSDLMKDDDGGPFGDCNHSGLLWALEALAWSSTYFSRAVEILRGMAAIDTGGRYSNRPAGSLTDIFMPIWPQTYSTAQERIRELDRLVSKDAKLVWNFTKSYHSGGHFTEAYRFRWRDYGTVRSGFDPETNPQEYQKELVSRLESLACTRANILDAMDEFTRLPNYIQTALINTLSHMDKDQLSPDEVKVLCSHIREAMNWISSYGEKTERGNLTPLKKLLTKFTPEYVLDRVGWLLDNPWPHLPEVSRRDRTDGDKEVSVQRGKAAREVLDKVPLEEIIKFSSGILYVGVLGQALGKAIKDDDEDDRVLFFFAKHAKNHLLISSYSWGRTEKAGVTWVEISIQKLKDEDLYSPEIGAQLYLGLPESQDVWTKVEKAGAELELEYWKHARGYTPDHSNEDAQIAAEKLLLAKRPQAALEIAGDHVVSLPSVLLRQIILDLLATPSEERHMDNMTEYHLSNVFRQLQERKELTDEEIAKLEWPCASLFRGMRDNEKTSFSIHKLLEKDPAFFCDLVGMVYKRDDKKANPKHKGLNSDQSDSLARNAKNVFDSWQGFPGLKDDKSLDDEELSTWVKAVRKICAEQSLVTGGDLELASVLAKTPHDTDGCWPHKAARKIIEELDNSVINRHIQSYVYNNRGVTSRGPYDGGTQERSLSEQYQKMSDQVASDWPTTASILKGIADFYAREANREDLDAELHEIKWG